MKCDVFFSSQDEQEFKRRFVVEFLASYASVHFVEYCMNGQHDALSRLPVEDAHFLACEAWDHWCDVVGLNDLPSKR